MRLAMVARADQTGLGTQCTEFYRHLRGNITKALIVDLCHFSPKDLSLNLPLYRGCSIRVSRGFPTDADITWLLADVDCVYTAETPYHTELFDRATKQGVRSVLHVNPEFCDHITLPDLPKPTVFACPTTWLYDRIPDPKLLLPVPVASDRFTTPTVADRATNFLHVVGHPAVCDRAGTRDVLAALPHITSPIKLTIRCQNPTYVSDLLRRAPQPSDNVAVVVDTGTIPHYWRLYSSQHILVHPRRYGGLNLPAQEALAAAIPAIMPNIPPNPDMLPKEWLVDAAPTGTIMTRTLVDVHTTNPRSLAAKIDEFATDHSFYTTARQHAAQWSRNHNWTTLLPLYRKVLFGEANAV